MQFWQAMGLLEQGMHLYRENWDTSRNIRKTESENGSAIEMFENHKSVGAWCPGQEDMTADDWEVEVYVALVQ